MSERPANWVFLGDSLTEGVGSSRISYVSELAAELREASEDQAVFEFRLRKVDPDSFNRFIRCNLAGSLYTDPRQARRALWLWNLACEGSTVDTDLEWLPFLQNLRPELVIVHRGSLESIVRPAMLRDGLWPGWVPRSWRGYAAMDPRCYFSTTWWRRIKQVVIDELKQKVRLSLLNQGTGVTLMDAETLSTEYRTLLQGLREVGTRVIVLGLLPLDGAYFPGSQENFDNINARLSRLAAETGAEFFDWASKMPGVGERGRLCYRDGFHPNQAGARLLAGILREHFSPVFA